MTTTYHTPIPAHSIADDTTFNPPLSQLDTQIVANTIMATAVATEVYTARGGAASLDARLDNMTFNYAGGNIATLTNGTAAAGQKDVTVDSTVGFLAGAWVAYTLVGGVVEYNQIASITPTTVLTMTENIGAGGIGDNSYIGMISISEYQAANSIPQGTAGLTLADVIAIINGGAFNVEAFGASPGASAAVNTAAIQAAIDACETSTLFNRVVFPAGVYAVQDDTLTLFDPDVSLNRKIPEFVGAGAGVTVLQIATPDTGKILTIEGSWRVAGITFRGYEDGTYSIGQGTGIYQVKSDAGAIVHDCRFEVLGYGFLTSVYTGGQAVNNFTLRDCTFDACSQAGVWVHDVNNDIRVERCHFGNGYPSNVGTAGNYGYGLRVGYCSGISIIDSNFRSHLNGLKLEGTQAPSIRNCYFETSFAESEAYVDVGPIGDGVAIVGDTQANGAATAGQKVVTVDSSASWYEGAIAVYHLAGGALEYNKVAAVDDPGVNQLTLVNNIGSGGIANNERIYASTEARSVLVDGCVASFYDTGQTFFKARYLKNGTLSNNWTTAAGAGLINADATVHGLVLINNRNDNDNTKIFTTDAEIYPPLSPPANAVGFIQAHYNPINLQYLALPRTIYALPDAEGSLSFLFLAGSTELLYAEANYVDARVGLKIGTGQEISKHIHSTQEINFSDAFPANSTEDKDITVSGAAVGDSVTVSPVGVPGVGLMFNAWVKSSNTVTVRCANVTASEITTVANHSFSIDVWQHP